MTRGALRRHFERMELTVNFDDGLYFNFRDLRFQHAARAEWRS